MRTLKIDSPTAVFVFSVATLLMSAHAAHADDCWIVGKMRCETAVSLQNYRFANDGFAEGMTLVCFAPDSGTVTGDDLQFTRFGVSTLIGVGQNSHGMETVGTYQIDRQHHKLFYTATRIGTDTVTGVLPDKVAACIGDASPAPSHK